MFQYELQLPSMSCQHCVRAVTEVVKQVDPQAAVEVDLAAKQVRIASPLPLAGFAQALAEEGYASA